MMFWSLKLLAILIPAQLGTCHLLEGYNLSPLFCLVCRSIGRKFLFCLKELFFFFNRNLTVSCRGGKDTKVHAKVL
jgi:hypothetical protein